MPNIHEYTNPINGLKPSETGAEAWNRAGMRISEYAHQAGEMVAGAARSVAGAAEQIEKQQGLHEVTQGAASGSAFLANKTAEWNDVASHTDPNDMGAAREKFMSGLQDDLQKFAGGFQTDRGKEWAAEHSAAMLNHFNQKTIADVSTAAGQSLRLNVGQMGDNLAAAVHNDPTALDASLAMIKPTVEAMVANSHGLSPEDAVTARTALTQDLTRRITHLGVASMMDRSVAAGSAMLSGKYASSLRPEDIQELQNYGKAVTRAKQADADHAQIQQMRAEQRASEARANQFLASMAPPGPDGRPGQVQVPNDAFQSVLRDPIMKPSEKTAIFGFMDRVQKDADRGITPRNDPATAADLMGRIGDPDAPTTKDQITEAVKAGKLTPQFGMELFAKSSNDLSNDMTRLNNSPVLKAEMDRASATIAGPNLQAAIGGTNQAVRAAMDSFKVDTLRVLQDAIQHRQDVSRYLDPKDPAYLFDPKRIEQYRPTEEERKKQLLAPPVQKSAGQGDQETGQGGTERPDLGEILRKALQFPAKPSAPANDGEGPPA